MCGYEGNVKVLFYFKRGENEFITWKLLLENTNAPQFSGSRTSQLNMMVLFDISNISLHLFLKKIMVIQILSYR